MTCIVAVKKDGAITMGGDSAGVAGLDVTVRRDPKVFTNGPFLLGGAGSFRQMQCLRFRLEPPRMVFDKNAEDPLYRYMVCDFMDAVRSCFEKAGVGQKDKQVETSQGLFLVGIRGRIFRIDTDYQVGESVEDYEAIGSGQAYARGSLHTTEGLDYSPAWRVQRALYAAEHMNGGVCRPFTILTQEA